MGERMTGCHPLSSQKQKCKNVYNMAIYKSVKSPVYRAISIDLLMGVTKYKVCDTHEYGII